jgi:integrase
MSRKIKEMNPRQVNTLPDGFWAAGKQERLYLRVSDGGRRRSWVFRFVKDRETFSMGLGRAGQGGVSLADARDKAKKHNEVIDSGENPLKNRREKEQAEAARKTLREAAQAFVEEMNPEWGASSQAIWRRFVDRDIEVIADIPVDTLGREHVKRAVNALYGQVGKGNRARLPGAPAARLLQQRISMVLSYASESGWRAENAPARWTMVAKRANGESQRNHPALMPPDGDNERDLALIVEAMQRLKRSDSVSARCLEFIALTAVRVGEAANAKWDEFNLRTGTWTIPAFRMKMGRKKPPDHVVPLSERAMAIIGECAKHRVNEYVFIGQHDDAPISRNTIHDQCDRVTEGRASPHGWRATFRSWAASQGVSFEVAEAALAHMGGPLKQAYQRSDLREIRRKVMEAYAQFLSGEDANADNVVNFASGARRA